ncbi:MAG: glycogen synthase [Clostridia bacterium]|nr:glycogen synthase [Clostridia bacterium]
MKILFAASEVYPFIKTGGLADVAGSLPKALALAGHDVRVVLPRYSDIPAKYQEAMEFVGFTYSDVGWRHQYCGIFSIYQDGVTYYFLDNEQYFKRPGLYGYFDDGERFAFFSKAILDFLPVVQFAPEIIHLNDWQTAMTAMFMRTTASNNIWCNGASSVLTIHNLKFQGIFPKENIHNLLGLGWEWFRDGGVEFNNCINFLKGGLNFADKITTVSPTYAEEIKTEFFGENLDGLIRRRAWDLVGIVNGIDNDAYNPENDTKIWFNYDSQSMMYKFLNKCELAKQLGLDIGVSEEMYQDALTIAKGCGKGSGKGSAARYKAALKRFNEAYTDPANRPRPVVSIISRLTSQKGLDLIENVMEDIMSTNLCFVVLGTGDQQYEDLMRKAQERWPGRFSANLMYNDALSRQIYAGSDILMMPSLFEPCGLSQLFALRYGTIPLVRETGGLNDTVKSYDPISDTGNGFSFRNFNAHDMLNTLWRAVSFYYDQYGTWPKLQQRAMEMDYSWTVSAQKYIDLYNSIR